MSETTREVKTKWGFEIDDDPLKKVEKTLEAIKRRLEFLAAAEIVKGIYELTEKFAEFAEQLHLMSESAGLTVEAFQKLAFAAKQSGISQEEMGHSMARLSRNLYEARKGGQEAQKVFADAGFSSEQIASFRTGEDVMLALGDRFKEIQDPIKKQAIAMELMGRGSQNMVGFLSKGSGAIREMGVEADRLGIILSGKQVESLVETEHALQKIWAVFKSLGAIVASYLGPEVTYVINQMLKFFEVNKKLVQVDIKKWVYDFSFALGFIWGILEGITKVVINFSNTHKTLFRLVEVLLIVGAAMFLVGTVTYKVTSAWQALGKAVQIANAFFKANPAVLWAIAIAAALTLVVVLAHDIWALFHGKPTWITSFVEWLGIEKEVYAIGDAIYQIFEDLSNLDFKKAFNDFIESIKDVWEWGKKVAGTFGIKFKATGEGGPGGENSSVGTALSNVEGLKAFGGNTSFPTASPGVASNNYSINAPLTVNAPHGMDAKALGNHVKEGFKEHLGTILRQTQSSTRPAQAY